MTSEDKYTIGRRIASMRDGLGMSQNELAKRLHMKNSATIQSWEQGKSAPGSEKLLELCKVFDCDSDFVLCLQDQPHKKSMEIADYIGLNYNCIEFMRSLSDNQKEMLCRVMENSQSVTDLLDNAAAGSAAPATYDRMRREYSKLFQQEKDNAHVIDFLRQEMEKETLRQEKRRREILYIIESMNKRFIPDLPEDDFALSMNSII